MHVLFIGGGKQLDRVKGCVAALHPDWKYMQYTSYVVKAAVGMLQGPLVDVVVIDQAFRSADGAFVREMMEATPASLAPQWVVLALQPDVMSSDTGVTTLLVDCDDRELHTRLQKLW